MMYAFAWFTPNPAVEILCPKAIPSVSMKWNFSQFKAKFLS